MLKYVNHDIVFQEYPDEVTLAVNLSLCPNHCPGCHSEYLWGNVGEELTAERLIGIAASYDGAITCIGIQGGDNDPAAVAALAAAVRKAHPALRIGWYSGRQKLPSQDFPEGFPLHLFDYIKLGPWRTELGPLKSRTTNQRFYRIDHTQGHALIDITERFWR